MAIEITVRETLAFTGPTSENVLTRRREQLTPGDDVNMFLEVHRTDEVALTDAVSSVTQYHRTTRDTVTISEAVVMALSIVRRETLRFIDEIVAGANAVYADLAVYNGGMSNSGLQDLSEYGPAGFGRFRPFRPGLYRFQELFFKTEMRSLSPNSLPRIDELVVVADVDERTEKGLGEVLTAPSGEAIITFKTEFYETPEIVAIFKTSATPCDVEVYAETSMGFRAKLKRRDTGAYITGTFTWAALGK